MPTLALVGISKIEYGTVQADGSMPIAMTDTLDALVPDSVTLTFEQPDKSDIFIEEQDAPYVTIPNPNRVRSLNFNLRDLSPATLELLFGGSVVTNTWSAPTSEAAIFYALQATSRTYDTTYYVVEIPKALIRASLDGKMYQTDTGELAVTAEVQAVDNAGTPVSPIQITKTN